MRVVGQSKLRYATYPDDSVEGMSAVTATGSSSVAPLFYRVGGDKEEKEEETEEFVSEFQSSLRKKKSDNNHKNNDNDDDDDHDDHNHGQNIQRRRKRARMLRLFSLRRLSKRQRNKNKSSYSFSSSSQQYEEEEESQARLLDYEQRKAAWAAKYTSVSSLRTTFGTNKNKIFGDFDPFTTRRLYHTLLPRALLELRGLRDVILELSSSSSSSSNEDEKEEEKKRVDRSSSSTTNRSIASKTTNNSNGGNNQQSSSSSSSSSDNNNKADLIIKQELKELAPLAYQARVAAKKYARERSRLPGRIGSMLYDGYRQWRRYGKWDHAGMSWDQVWAKYEDQVLGEVMEEMMLASSSSEEEVEEELATTAAGATLFNNYGNDLDDEELTARICLRILERSVATNEMVDKLFRRTDEEEEDISKSSSLDENTPLKRRRRHERQQRRKARILNDLRAIEEKFDEDIQELLRYSKFTTEEGEERRRKRQKGAFFWKKPLLTSTSSSGANEDDDDDASSRVVDVTTSARGGAVDAMNASVEPSEAKDVAAALFSVSDATTDTETPKKKSPPRKLARHEIVALRILATTKQRIASLQATKEE
jgi:hypothetical protein